jgi:hypothetical protein
LFGNLIRGYHYQRLSKLKEDPMELPNQYIVVESMSYSYPRRDIYRLTHSLLGIDSNLRLIERNSSLIIHRQETHGIYSEEVRTIVGAIREIFGWNNEYYRIKICGLVTPGDLNILINSTFKNKGIVVLNLLKK